MAEASAQKATKALALRGREAIRALGEEPDDPFARATFIRERNDSLMNLPEFRTALAEFQATRTLTGGLYGYLVPRLLLSFLTVHLTAHPGSDDDSETVFDEEWAAFVTELRAPEWKVRAAANLANVESLERMTDLGNGIQVAPRDVDMLVARGFSEGHIDRLERDWNEEPGDHLIVVEVSQPKTPGSFLAEDTVTIVERVRRMLLAMRLHKAGDVASGPMVCFREERFPVTPRGVLVIGGMGFKRGRSISRYSLSPADVPSIQEFYRLLEIIEADQNPTYGRRRVGVALRSFNSAYEREFYQRETRILDCVTALEALVGTGGTELTFKIAFRIASIFADDDDGRVQLFQAVKSFYDTRSKLIHGEAQGLKDQGLLQDDEPLRSLVRKALSAFVRLVTSADAPSGRGWWENLDKRLLHAVHRERLRAEMGLTEVKPR